MNLDRYRTRLLALARNARFSNTSTTDHPPLIRTKKNVIFNHVYEKHRSTLDLHKNQNNLLFLILIYTDPIQRRQPACLHGVLLQQVSSSSPHSLPKSSAVEFLPKE